MEGGRGVHHPARHYRQDPVRVLAAGAAGVHRPDLSEDHTMLKDYKGSITVKIDAIAASAASVVAMAGDTVQMSPVAMLMIHDPSTVAMGNTKDMEKAIEVLTEVKQQPADEHHLIHPLNGHIRPGR